MELLKNHGRIVNMSPQEAPAIHSESKLQAWKESTKDA